MNEQLPVKLFSSLIFKDEECLRKAERDLVSVYGEKEDKELDLPFDYTDYYRSEFGYPLRRKMVCFKALVEKENIRRVKIETGRIERKYVENGKRRVNIDPGYVVEGKLVLFSTKDYTHRVYLGEGIFAESTLFFRNGTFSPWPWTYPDYASEVMIEFLNSVRELYSGDIRGMKNACEGIPRADKNADSGEG